MCEDGVGQLRVLRGESSCYFRGEGRRVVPQRGRTGSVAEAWCVIGEEGEVRAFGQMGEEERVGERRGAKAVEGKEKRSTRWEGLEDV